MQLPLSSCLQDFVFGPVLFLLSVITLLFFPHLLKSPSMLTISLYGPPPQTLTCNRHCQAAFKILFLDQSFLFINDHPAFFSSSVEISFNTNELAIWASSPNVDVQPPLSRCLQDFVLGPVLFLLSMIILPFYPHPLKSPCMLTISLYEPRPQTLTCNCHCQAAFKILFLDQSFFIINDHPAFFPHLLKSPSMLTILLYGLSPKR